MANTCLRCSRTLARKGKALYLFSDRRCRIPQTRIQPGSRRADSLTLHDQNRVEMIHAAHLRGLFTMNFNGAGSLSSGSAGMHRHGECFAVGATRTKHAAKLYYDSVKPLRGNQARSLTLSPGAPRRIALSVVMAPGIWRMIRVLRHLSGRSRSSATIALKKPSTTKAFPPLTGVKRW
jgi:hypothetical protein